MLIGYGLIDGPSDLGKRISQFAKRKTAYVIISNSLTGSRNARTKG